jgi:ribosome-associated toxin RatA of RatAB toxin-antitoxin module
MGAVTATQTIEIDASPEELFAIVSDLESYPEWVDAMREVEILDVDDNDLPLRSTMTLDVSVRTVRYTLSYEYDYPVSMEWTSEEGGDIRRIDGSYRFDQDAEGEPTTVTYELTIDPGFPVPGFLMRKAQQAIISAALNGLKQQAEG